MVKIHNVRFYKPDPRAIYSMSLQKAKQKLAVVRSDSCIEIWNLRNVPYIEKIIPNISNYNVQGLVWSRNRLFGCTLQGFLHEYNLLTLSVQDKQSLVGEAAYCLDVNKNHSNIVVGTENGYLNIFDITDEQDVRFIKFLDKQEGRVLCVKYDHTGKFIVAGSTDAIRIWDTKSGNALHKMTTGRNEIHKTTIVWCLEVTENFTIISGDSRGKLTFWDGNVGAQIESYQSHRADILSLTLSDDENIIFCAGADPTLISYAKVKIKAQKEKWVKSIQRKVHDHDVRALVLFNNKLYSGGVDGYLACSYHPPKTLIKYPPILQNNCVTIANSERLILLQYSNHIEVWTLGMPAETSNENGLLQLTNDIKKLLHLERVVKNDSNEAYKETVICSSISSDGKWIGFSTAGRCRLYNFNYDTSKKAVINRVKNLPSDCGTSIRLAFTPDSKELIMVLLSGGIIVVNLESMSIEQRIETETFFSNVIFHLVISWNGRYLIVADIESNIVVWARNSNGWKYYSKLPHYKCAPTSLAVEATSNNLWIAYADHKVVEYSLEDKRFTHFSRVLDTNKMEKYVNKNFPIRNITFDLVNKNIILLHDDTNILVINKNKQSSQSSTKMAKKSKKSEEDSRDSKIHFSSHKKYQHLVHLEALSEDEIVAVEINPLILMEKLPPCLKQNTFGTK